jgi:hypothetical protein
MGAVLFASVDDSGGGLRARSCFCSRENARNAEASAAAPDGGAAGTGVCGEKNFERYLGGKTGSKRTWDQGSARMGEKTRHCPSINNRRLQGACAYLRTVFVFSILFLSSRAKDLQDADALSKN